MAAVVVADDAFVLDEDFFEIEEIQDLNSHAAAWEADPYYAAALEEGLGIQLAAYIQ